MVWGFSGAGLGPFVPVKGTLNESAYQEILDNSMLPTLCEQFGDGPFLYQHDCVPVHKARSIKTWIHLCTVFYFISLFVRDHAQQTLDTRQRCSVPYCSILTNFHLTAETESQAFSSNFSV